MSTVIGPSQLAATSPPYWKGRKLHSPLHACWGLGASHIELTFIQLYVRHFGDTIYVLCFNVCNLKQVLLLSLFKKRKMDDAIGLN